MVRRGEIRRRREQSQLNPRKHPKPKKKITNKFYVECSIPEKDGILDLDHFVKYLKLKYKVNGLTENLGRSVKIFRIKGYIRVHTEIKTPKRSIKYYTKKYLKKQSLNLWIRIVTAKDDEEKGKGYKLQYHPMAEDDDDGDSDEESSDGEDN